MRSALQLRAYAAFRVVRLLTAFACAVAAHKTHKAPVARIVQSAGPRPFERGDRIGPLSGVVFAAADATLILAIRSDCGACQRDLPFYRSLLHQCRASITSGRLGIAVVSSESRATLGQWLADEQLPFQVVLSDVPPSNTFRVLSMPALILADRAAVIVEGWIGERSDDSEANIIRRLCTGSRSASDTNGGSPS